jgi:hypothetical protein
MSDEQPRARVEVRLDPATARDLAALERHFRVSPSAVVRMALADMARRLGLSKEPEDTKQVA